MAEQFEHGFKNLDLSNAVLLDAALLEDIKDPASSPSYDVVILTPSSDPGSPDPTYALEQAFAERYECATDEDGFFMMTFALGSIYKAVRTKYDKQFTTPPELIIARLALGKDSEVATTEYVLPVATSGHRSTAVTQKILYSPKTVSNRGPQTAPRRELTKKGIGEPRIGTNPFYSSCATKQRVGSYTITSSAIHGGRLGTIN